MTMHHDAVIFDIDGTLWDASPVSAEGWNAGLAKLGIARKVSPARIRSVTGNPYEKCVDILLPGLKARYPDLIQTLNDSEMAAIRSSGGRFYPGVIEGVRGLSDNFRVFLVSNCQEWYLKLFLDFSGLGPVLSGYDCHGSSGLPKSAMLRRIKSGHSLNCPEYVGDTAGDRLAAIQAGIEFIHAAWGFGEPEEGAKTVRSFAELLEYLRDENSAA
jgi:phosphoglycolate phosphatase